jgi:ribosome-associated protein
MADQRIIESSPTFEPVPALRKKIVRPRANQTTQDDVPHYATERREPRRAAVALERARVCARIADDNRGKDILLLDLRQTTPLVDFFVITTAGSRRLANAIASEVDQAMKKLGEVKLGIEGSEEGRWTLIDYGDFVVHIFSPDYRSYYALEEIWGDAPQLEWIDSRPEGTRAEK